MYINPRLGLKLGGKTNVSEEKLLLSVDEFLRFPTIGISKWGEYDALVPIDCFD